MSDALLKFLAAQLDSSRSILSLIRRCDGLQTVGNGRRCCLELKMFGVYNKLVVQLWH